MLGKGQLPPLLSGGCPGPPLWKLSPRAAAEESVWLRGFIFSWVVYFSSSVICLFWWGFLTSVSPPQISMFVKVSD